MSTVFCRMTGPSSRPSSGSKLVRPVCFLPMMIGQLIELGPRCSGGREGCYRMVTLVGRSTTHYGTNRVTATLQKRPGRQVPLRSTPSAELTRYDNSGSGKRGAKYYTTVVW